MEAPEHTPSDPEPFPPDPDMRPLSVTAAAVALLTVSVFAGLVGLVLLVVVMVNSNPAALPAYIDAAPEGFTTAAAVIGLGLAFYGLAGTVVAIQVMRRRARARGIGIVLAALGVAVLTVAMIGPGRATGATPLIFVPVIAALAYAAVALASERRWFEAAAPGSGTG
ncbi:MAG TPA: hypothetical protein VJY85_06555 [Candidatus Limnocylindria bacterium]|nr:hypothetical protein [Candidatus Limnocylindria bacterium]